MSNPIKASDLYQDDGALDQAITKLDDLRRTYVKNLDAITAEAEKLIKQLKKVNTATSEGRKTTSQAATDAEKLKKAQKQYSTALGETEKQIRALKQAQKEEIKNQQLKTKLAKAAEGSYEKLAAQYALNKMRLDKMSKSQRENTRSGQVLEKQTRAIYSEMQNLQKATKASSDDKDKLRRTERQYNAALDETNTKIRELQEARKEEVRLQKLQTKQANAAEGSYDKLSATYSINKIKLNAMSKEMREGTAEGRKLETQTREIYEEMDRLQKATGKHQLSVGNYRLAVSNLHPVLGQVDMALSSMGTSLDDIANSKNPFQTLTTGIQNFGRAALAFALSPIGLLLTALGGLFLLIKNNKDTVLEFNDGLLNVSKTTGLAGEDLDRLGSGIIMLSRRLKTVGTPQLMEYATVAGQLGVRGTQNILNFAEALAKLETSSDISGEEGASQIARLLTLTDGGVENVASFGDEIVNLGNNFAATEKEILSNATAIAQNTGQYRVGRRWVLAYATATKAAGVEAELTGSTVGRTLGRMEKAIRTGRGLQDIAQLTNQSVEELRRSFKEDASETFTDFIKGLNEVHEAGGSVNAELEKIGITAVRDQRVLGTLATAGFDTLTRSMDEVRNSVGALDQEFLTASNKLKNQLNRVGIAWDNLILTVENGQGIFGKTATFFSAVFADVLERLTFNIQLFSAFMSGLGGAFSAVKDNAWDFIQTIAQFSELKFDPFNPTKIFKDAKTLLTNAKKQFVEGGKDAGEAFTKNFNKTMAIMSKVGTEGEAAAEQAAALLDAKIKNGIASVGELSEKIQELQQDLEGARTQGEAKPIQDEIAALQKKRDAILGVVKANQKEKESRESEQAKLELDVMEDGESKEVKALEIEMNEKRRIWQEAGMDMTALEEYYQRRKAEIKQKYRDLEKQKAKEHDEKIAQEKAKLFSAGMERISQEEALAKSEIDLVAETEEEKTKLRLIAERERLKKILELNKRIGGQLTDLQIQQMHNVIDAINNSIAEIDSSNPDKKDIFDHLGLKVNDKEKAAIKDAVSTATNFAIQQITALAQARVQAADANLQKQREITDEIKTKLQEEIEARNAGYANNVATMQKELQDQKRKEEQALKEKEKAKKAQLAIDTVMQTSSLITASANIWKSLSGITFIGPALAVAAIGTMWASFAASKMKAASMTKEEYGEGHFEILQGGSHASGNDIPFGHTGTKERRVEGGEAFAVINKKQTRKYRAELPGIIESLNKGNFDEKYGKAFLPSEEMPAAIFQGGVDSPDLKQIESDLATIRDRGEERYHRNANGQLVRKYKNITTVYV